MKFMYMMIKSNPREVNCNHFDDFFYSFQFILVYLVLGSLVFFFLVHVLFEKH